jgi:hypothetical protein
MTLVELLRNGNTFKIVNIDINYNCNFVRYSKQYNSKWTDKELLENVIKLNCCELYLKSLPELPNCTYLNCFDNKLKSLPKLPNCTVLDCSYNEL